MLAGIGAKLKQFGYDFMERRQKKIKASY